MLQICFQILVQSYRGLVQFHAGGRVMIIETGAALRLMNKYFKNIEL
jgi:hypothetical protein